MLDAAGRSQGKASLVLRLVREIGITESQATDLVAILGTDWSSLVREARIIRQAEVATKVGRPA